MPFPLIQCSTVLVEFFYQNGAKLTLCDERGRGCLHYAALTDDAGCVYTCTVYFPNFVTVHIVLHTVHVYTTHDVG